MVVRTSSLLLLLALAGALEATPIRRALAPAVSPEGSRIAFSWQGDIWIGPAKGGPAMRLTVHPARDWLPVWFPDGNSIAFASDRYGSMDVFRLDADGTNLRRLTFEGAFEYPTSVSSDGRFIYGYTNAWSVMDVFRVSATGGDIIRLSDHPLERAYWPTVAPDGRWVAHVRGGTPGSWRSAGMRGAYSGEIWLAEATAPMRAHRNLTNDDANDLFPLFADDGSITFVSNRSGTPNLWRMSADGKGARALTRYTSGRIAYPSISRDGRWAAFERGGAIALLDAQSGRIEEVEFVAPPDRRENPTARIVVSSGVENFAFSPDGKRGAVAARGEVFLIPERGGPTRRLTSNPAYDGAPEWLNATTVLFVTGRTGRREIWTVTDRGVESPLLADAGADLVSPRVSPDGKWIAYYHDYREVRVVPAEGGAPRTLLTGDFRDGFYGDTRFSWSPDSQWIAAQLRATASASVVLVHVPSGKVDTVGRLVYRPNTDSTTGPEWLADGRGLYFLGDEFAQTELFVIDLRPPSVTFLEDELDPPAEKKDKPVVAVEPYMSGILQRMRRLTTGGASNPAASEDGKTLYVTVGGQFGSVPAAGGTFTPITGVTGASRLRATPKTGRLHFVQGGRLMSYTPGAPNAALVPFAAEVVVDAQEEERALFAEICRLFELAFYDPKLHGRPWPELRKRYEAMLPSAVDRADFYNLIDEFLYELDSSHLGASAPSGDTGASESTGFIGAEWDWAAFTNSGSFVVAGVLPGTPAAHPDSLLMVGDRLVAVDGVEIGPGRTLASLLSQKVGRRVELKVQRRGREVDVRIRPASPATRSEANYQAWVARNREAVRKASGGRLGYVHYRQMNRDSHETWLREIRTGGEGKEGMVIDVRYNGGGSTAHQALGVMIRTPWLLRTERGQGLLRQSENLYRGEALEMPSVMLINQHSFSNAEIFAEGYRRLRLGKLVGEQTAGGVIGTAGVRLWDGGSVRLPSIGAYTIDGENLEGTGRKPDIQVRFDPDAWTAGRDPQLEKAVETLLAGLPRKK